MQQTVDFDRQVVLPKTFLQEGSPIHVVNCQRPQGNVGGADLGMEAMDAKMREKYGSKKFSPLFSLHSESFRHIVAEVA